MGKPVSTEADEVEVKVDSSSVLKADRKDAECFRDVTDDNAERVSRQDLELRVISPVLEGTAQWRFSAGARRTFPAKIEDTAFLDRVALGRETFAKGDRIVARVRTEQFKGPRGGLRLRYAVEEVLKREAPVGEPDRLL